MPPEALRALVRQTFAAALGHDVADDADFFAEGGDSLAAEQVLTGLSAALSLPLPGWLLLDHPTAGALADAIRPALGQA